ncbi:MAG TPA: arginine--tRNA ligase [Candidatus Saccharimonadales bacterium]|nr:arginine--tRNA ligase [Candidatus Saccharimonadales bacterium]
MKEELEKAIGVAVTEIWGKEIAVELTRPDEQFGDFATNVALQLAGTLGTNPRQVAEQLVTRLQESGASTVREYTIAGPGFINLRLTDTALVAACNAEPAKTYAGQVIVAEYSDPNPFKVLHAGHLYTSVVGDAIANLFVQAGGDVHRVNFGGDVGLHVGKTLWALLEKLGGEYPEKLADIPANERAPWMAEAYVRGTNAYDDDPIAKDAIIALNKAVYGFHERDDHTSPLAQIYWTCREWSYDYFNEFYARIGTSFEKYYPESETAGIGLETVRRHIGEVFEESEGAIVFKGENHDLHTRVFINSQGLPTYEAKDVGLIMKKWDDYHFNRSVVITGNEQMQYMQVVLKAIEQFAPELARSTTHLTHGIVKLAGGVKMSSRKGNILRAVDVLDAAAAANKEVHGQEDEGVTLGAVKYAFLRQRTGGDIMYDPQESVSLEGNSGPYLQYAHARARSMLRKTETQPGELTDLEAGERSLVRKLAEFAEVVDKATSELMPHHICTYLYELAQKFNSFYEHNRVIGSDRETQRLRLVRLYADTLQHGLALLGISAPDQM